MIKKNHRLFWRQFLMAFLVFVGLASIFVIPFKADSESKGYMLANKKITNLRESSSKILEDLMRNKNVTFDPTNGTSIKSVLENLKCSEKKKILLLGSSQLVTINDDWSYDNYLNRVDKRLENLYEDDAVVYNMSMGGMTVPEKKIVSNKIQEILKFDKIIISIGPYDCREFSVRSAIEEIVPLTFKKSNNEDCDFSKQSLNYDDFTIEKINSNLENWLEYRLKNNSFFFENKSAIRDWAKEKTKNFLLQKPFYKPKKPLGWRTHNQELNDLTGWTNNISHSGSKSLKIIKKDEDSNSSWEGFKVDLEKPTNKIALGGWSKSENVIGPKLYCLDFKIDFIDGTNKWLYDGLTFTKGTNNWTNREIVVQFDKKIKSITPKMLFYKGVGTVWFDDIYARPIYDRVEKNALLNSSAEEESNVKDVHSLKFDESIWTDIIENAKDMTSHIAKTTSKDTQVYILIPPIYNSNIKKGYEQDYLFDKFLFELSEVCKKSGVSLLNANNLLDESHFIEYESGDRKGIIEPLHFDTNGHQKLAKYLKKNIEI